MAKEFRRDGMKKGADYTGEVMHIQKTKRAVDDL